MMKVQGLFLVAIFCLSYTQLVKGQTLLGCQTKCGNVIIEYPFGTSPGCYYDEDPSFKLTCNETEKLLFNGLEVVNISHSSQLRVLIPRSYVCFNILGNISEGNFYKVGNLGNLTLSQNNRLTAVGCNTFAFLTAFGTRRNSSVGCTSLCDSTPVGNSECDGVGCCQNPVPAGSNQFEFSPYRFTYQTSTRTYVSRCIYAFLVENDTFKFNAEEDFENLRNVTTRFPVVLDWSIGNKSCEQVGKDSLCSVDSVCTNSTSRTGYVCKCKDGYHGNPYLPKGCQDIDECTIPTEHNCKAPSTCENKMGHYLCNCPSGYSKDSPNSCTPKDMPEYLRWSQIFLGTTIGFLITLLAVSCIKQKMKHRKDTKLRQHFFEQNGGGMLIQRVSGAGPSSVDVQIFTEEGMKEATNGYDESRILGQGGVDPRNHTSTYSES